MKAKIRPKLSKLAGDIIDGYGDNPVPIEHFKKVMMGLIEGFLKISSDIIRFRLAHRLSDEIWSGVDKAEVSCKQGCSSCCHMQIGIFPAEADILYKHLTPERVAHLKIQQGLSEDLDQWFASSKEATRCVFLLEDGSCGVYEDRPLACRNYYVTSDPKLCSSGSTDTVSQLASAHSEAVTSALLTLGYSGEPMYKLLWKKREEKINARSKERTKKKKRKQARKRK